jgi:hypothetical protein
MKRLKEKLNVSLKINFFISYNYNKIFKNLNYYR